MSQADRVDQTSPGRDSECGYQPERRRRGSLHRRNRPGGCCRYNFVPILLLQWLKHVLPIFFNRRYRPRGLRVPGSRRPLQGQRVPLGRAVQQRQLVLTVQRRRREADGPQQSPTLPSRRQRQRVPCKDVQPAASQRRLGREGTPCGAGRAAVPRYPPLCLNCGGQRR